MTGTTKSLRPTNKWVVQQITVVGGWVIAAINAGWHMSAALEISAVGIVVAAIASWLTPNDNAPGGVARVRR